MDDKFEQYDQDIELHKIDMKQKQNEFDES